MAAIGYYWIPVVSLLVPVIGAAVAGTFDAPGRLTPWCSSTISPPR